VLGLIANAGVLEAEEVANVLAGRVNDHSVLGEAGGKVSGIEVVVCLRGRGEGVGAGVRLRFEGVF
jgi:hypothetical protein